MNELAPDHSINSRGPAVVSGAIFMVAAVLLLVGCGQSDSESQSTKRSDSATPLNGTSTSANLEPAVAGPARVGDALRTFDLSTQPLFKGAETPSERTVTSLMYRTSGSVEEGFEFHRAQLLGTDWKEFPGTSLAAHSGSATFEKNGLRLSLSVFPDQPGKVVVALRHHGNVDFTKIPLPAGSKPLYAGPASAIFVVDLPVEAAAKDVAETLGQLGWAPYGHAGNSRWFRQRAVKLSVTTASAPAQGGKTTITFSSELLPAEIPAPASAMDVTFSYSPKRLTFQVPMSQDDCVKYYREDLPADGWRNTMEAPTKIDQDQVIVFRNEANDMLELAMRSAADGKLRVAVDYRTAAEIAEMNRKLDAQAAAFKAQNAIEKPAN